MPKQKINKIFDLDKETYTKLMGFSRQVALALRQVVDCKRIGMSVMKNPRGLPPKADRLETSRVKRIES